MRESPVKFAIRENPQRYLELCGIRQVTGLILDGNGLGVRVNTGASANHLNGNTIINTPANWTLRQSQVNWLGHYLFDRDGSPAPPLVDMWTHSLEPLLADWLAETWALVMFPAMALVSEEATTYLSAGHLLLGMADMMGAEIDSIGIATDRLIL